MMNTLRSKYALGALAGLSLVGTLAGCSSTTASTSTDSGSTSNDATTSDSSATYKDGSYTESGDYTSPGGPQTIDVKLTVADNKVTAVTVTPHATDQDAVKYQGEFADGISAVVVGKDLSSLTVSRVAGSSLTSQGFNAAVTKIKADAS